MAPRTTIINESSSGPAAIRGMMATMLGMTAFILAYGMTGVQMLAIAALFVALLFYQLVLSREARDRRRMRDTPVTTIAAAPVGQQVRLQGIIQRHEAEFTAPISQRRGVYYCSRLEQYRNKSWRELVREVQEADFILRDASGEALVRVRGARWLTGVDHHSTSGTFEPADEAQSAFLRRHDRSATNFLGLNRSLRYEECVLEVGSRVSVFATRAPGSGPAIVFEAGPRGELVVGDDPQAPALTA